jgi:hypothetical protein
MSAPGAAQQLPQKNWGDYSCVIYEWRAFFSRQVQTRKEAAVPDISKSPLR